MGYFFEQNLPSLNIKPYNNNNNNRSPLWYRIANQPRLPSPQQRFAHKDLAWDYPGTGFRVAFYYYCTVLV